MTDQEIEAAGEALKRLLRKHRDCHFAKIEGCIAKNKIKELKLYPESPGILNGEVVVLETTTGTIP